MALYEINAPDGHTFLVDGDHEPSQAEAENIWKASTFLGASPSLKPTKTPPAPVPTPPAEPTSIPAEYRSWSERPGGLGAFARVIGEGPRNVMNMITNPGAGNLERLGQTVSDAGSAAKAAAPTALRVGLPVAAAAVGNPIPAIMAAGGIGDVAAQSVEKPGENPNLLQTGVMAAVAPFGAKALPVGAAVGDAAAQGVMEGAVQSVGSDVSKAVTGQPVTKKEMVENLLLSSATGGLLRGVEAKFLTKVDEQLTKAGVAPVSAEVKPFVVGDVEAPAFSTMKAGTPPHPASMMLSDVLPEEKIGDYVARMVSKVRRTQGDGAIGYDLTQTKELLDKALAQVDNVAATGTFQPKSIRPDLAIGGPANPAVFVNPEIVQQTNKQFVEIGSLLRDLRRTAETSYDEGTHVALGLTEKLYEQSLANMREVRRTSGLTLAEYQKGVDGMRRALALMPKTQDVVRRLPPWRSAIVNIGNNNYPAAFKDAVDFTRQNLFGLFSFGMDVVNNAAAVGVKAPGWIAADATSLARGEPATRLAGIAKAITNPKETFAIPDFMKAEMGATFNGEKLTMGNSLVDWTFALPAKLKGAVDGYFANTFAAADLYSSALTEAKNKGLQGDAKDKFVSAFLRNPTDAAADSAIELGNKMKFNRELSKVEEKIAGSTGVKLFADAFPRWSFQFSRWMAESLGADPKMIRSIKSGEATAPQIADYIGTTAAGWGGVALVNQALYDHTDFSTMEYVREDGRRVRLSNLSPLPDALMLSAAMRGDEEKFKSAVRFSSLVGSQVRLKGLLSDLLNTTAQSLSGDNTGATMGREMTKFANSLIPGQALLGALKAAHDPEMREGFGANVPIVSEQLPLRYNTTSGQPMKNEQDLGGSHFVGINVPLGTRELNPVEKAFLNHGMGLRRPGRTTLLDIPAPDVPKELVQEYEKNLGIRTKEIVEPLVKDPDFNKLPFAARKMVLERFREAANKMAKSDLKEKHDNFSPADKVTPFETRLLPEYLRR